MSAILVWRALRNFALRKTLGLVEKQRVTNERAAVGYVLTVTFCQTMESVSKFGRYEIKLVLRESPSPADTNSDCRKIPVSFTRITLRDEGQAPVMPMPEEVKALSASSSGASLSSYNDVMEYISARHEKEEYRAERRLRNVAACANDHP